MSSDISHSWDIHLVRTMNGLVVINPILIEQKQHLIVSFASGNTIRMLLLKE